MGASPNAPCRGGQRLLAREGPHPTPPPPIGLGMLTQISFTLAHLALENSPKNLRASVLKLFA